MCMGFGCNAAGIVGCRIIDSPRERLIAMVTNNFVPCNGRFPTLIALISMFFVGILAAGTMVVPGVSGSMIMMMIGVYEPLLQTTNGCIRAAAAFDFPALLSDGLVLLPYFTGLGLGIFLFAKIVEHLLVNHERQMYRVIIGLVFSSPVVILWDVAWKQIELYQLLGGISLCLLGYVAAVRCGGEG